MKKPVKNSPQKQTRQPGAKAPRLPKGSTLELAISALDEDGCGVGIADTCQVRVRGALPGETVIARVEHAGQHRVVADMVKVIVPSAVRRKSPCNHIPECDGCPLIQMDYGAQLAWKQGLVENHVHRYAPLARTEILPVLPSPRQIHYRNSAKLVIAGKFADPIIGIYRRESHDVLDISDCTLHHPLINRIASVVKKGIVKGKVPIYHPRSEQGLLRYLVVRVAENENRAMVVLVTTKRSYNEMHHLSEFIKKEVPEVMVVVQNVNASTGNVILGNRDFFNTKQTSLEASLGTIKFLISPRSFFQVNSGSARVIYELVQKFAALTGREKVLDLYCGIGAISLFLASGADEVLGIEVVETAVEDARLNAKINRIRNCEFEAGDAVEQLKWVVESGDRMDLVVLNPPRKGCEEKVLHQVVPLGSPRIIYVSCSPASLARDLVILDAAGYQTELIQPVDMFPQTPHVESIAVLKRRQSD
jgi:23S rRNA (uracil1939-C5)-methyltransferase